jgi:hypothetical protein
MNWCLRRISAAKVQKPTAQEQCLHLQNNKRHNPLQIVPLVSSFHEVVWEIPTHGSGKNSELAIECGHQFPFIVTS